MKKLISTSALTEANVADLRAIQARMLALTEHAENIIARSNEVLPLARSGWLRKIKAALGLLAVKDGHTLDDTIEFCERLVGYKVHASDLEGPIDNIPEWAGEHRLLLFHLRKKINPSNIPGGIQHIQVCRVGNARPIGALVLSEGQWRFVLADSNLKQDFGQYQL